MITVTQLTQILQTSIVPVALISGIGLILLSLTNRFSRVTDRIRLFTSDRKKYATRRVRSQVKILYERARLLRMAIVLCMASVLCSSLLMFSLFVVYFLNFRLEYLLIIFAGSLFFLVSSVIIFIYDLTLAFKALKIEIGN